MRALHLIALATLLFTSVEGAAPNIQITEVEQGKQGKLSLLDFFIRARDADGISYIKYRAAVDGKQGRWTRYPYYDIPGYVNHLPFRVDCDLFVFEVYAVDRKGTQSRILRRTFSNLR
jgi:hypothetical protein